MPMASDLSRRLSSSREKVVLRGLALLKGFGNFKKKFLQSTTSDLIARPWLIPNSSWEKRTLFVPARKSGPGAFYQLTILRKISSRSPWGRFFQVCGILSFLLLLTASVLAGLVIRSLVGKPRPWVLEPQRQERLLLYKKETGDLI